MTEAQISQIITIIGVLVTTLNAFVLFYIANHQRTVAAELKKFNGTVIEALNASKRTHDEPNKPTT